MNPVFAKKSKRVIIELDGFLALHTNMFSSGFLDLRRDAITILPLSNRSKVFLIKGFEGFESLQLPL